MRIDAIEIRNFRRFAKVDLELPDGVIALIGRNGAGKSTLLEAIGWCLYGNEAARTKKELIRRRAAASDDSVRVRIAFRFGDDAYEITRELLGKNESHVATVLVNGKVVVPPGARSGNEATGYVTRLFHMDREAFFTSLVARQRELAALTDAPPSERKKILISLLRLDAVDQAIKIAREKKRDERKTLEGLRSAIKQTAPIELQLTALRTTLEADVETIRLADQLAQKLSEEVEDVKARRAASRKRFEEYRNASTQILTSVERVTSLANQRATRAAELARARSAGEQAAKLAVELEALPATKERCDHYAALRVRHEDWTRVRAELVKADQEVIQSQRVIQEAEGALASAGTLRSLTERAAASRKNLEAQATEGERIDADCQARLREARRALADVTQKSDKIRAMGPDSPCPTCTRPLHEHHDQLLHGFAAEAQAHQNAIAALGPQAEAARSRVTAARSQLLDLSGREAEIHLKITKLAREEERLNAAQRALAEASARSERYRAQAKAFESEPYDPTAHNTALALLRHLEGVQQRHARLVSEADRAAEAARILTELDAAEADARAKEQQHRLARDALQFSEAEHDALEKAADASEARLSEARLKRERVMSDHARRRDEEQRVAADLEQQRALAQRALAIERSVQLLEHLAGDRDLGLLPEFKDHLIGRVRPMLTAHAGRLFRELTEGRYADLEVAEDYDLRVHDEGQAFALERFSGGESDLANLCLRLAVSQVVAERAGTAGFGFLALDEVFGSQDETRKANILRALKALSGRFRQIVLITHIDDVKESAEHVLRVTALDDGTSVVGFET